VSDRYWSGDITYIWTAEGWLYLALLLDLFSRRVVGWSMSHEMTAQLVVDAFTMAVGHRRPSARIKGDTKLTRDEIDVRAVCAMRAEARNARPIYLR